MLPARTCQSKWLLDFPSAFLLLKISSGFPPDPAAPRSPHHLPAAEPWLWLPCLGAEPRPALPELVKTDALGRPGPSIWVL